MRRCAGTPPPKATASTPGRSPTAWRSWHGELNRLQFASKQPTLVEDGAAWCVRPHKPRGRYRDLGSCPCRSLGSGIWRPPAKAGLEGSSMPTAEAAASAFPRPPCAPRPAAPTLVPALLRVPMLAFDRACRRLGYAAGFYDRTLAGLRRTGATLAVGLAFSAQEVERVPAGTDDASLDAVVTEHEVMVSND